MIWRTSVRRWAAVVIMLLSMFLGTCAVPTMAVAQALTVQQQTDKAVQGLLNEMNALKGPRSTRKSDGISTDFLWNLRCWKSNGLINQEKLVAILRAKVNGSYRRNVYLGESWVGLNFWGDASENIHYRSNGPDGKYYASKDREPLYADLYSTEFGIFGFRTSCQNPLVGTFPPPVRPSTPATPSVPVKPGMPAPPPSLLMQAQDQSQRQYQYQEQKVTVTNAPVFTFSPQVIINPGATPSGPNVPVYGYYQVQPGQSADSVSGSPGFYGGYSNNSQTFIRRPPDTPDQPPIVRGRNNSRGSKTQDDPRNGRTANKFKRPSKQ